MRFLPWTWILGLFSGALLAQTSLPKKIPCFNQLTKNLDALGVVEEWFSYPNGVAGSFKNSSSIEVNLGKESIYVVTRTDKNKLSYLAQEPNCGLQITKIEEIQNEFSDLEFAKLLKKNQKGGIVYLWSPHMAHSVIEIQELPKFKLGFPYTVVLDPKADRKLASEIISKHKLPQSYLIPLASKALFDVDATIHYPSTIFYKDGKISIRVPGRNGGSFPALVKRYLK